MCNERRLPRPMLRMIAMSLLALSLVALSSLAGCATSSDMTAMQGRVSKLERSRAADSQRLKRDQHRMKRLLDEIEQSTGFLRQSGAELTARLDALEDKLRKARGELEVINHRMAAIAKHTRGHRQELDALRGRVGRLIADLRDRAGIAILALPRELPEKAEDWVTLAQEHFDYGEVRIAEAVAKECTKRFEATPTAGRCASIQARIAYEEHRFADALKILQRVHDSLNAKAIPVVGKALLQIGVVLRAQGKCRQAADVLKYLRSEMPRLPHAKVAKQQLADLKSGCKQGTQTLPTKTSGTRKRPIVRLPGGATASGI